MGKVVLYKAVAGVYSALPGASWAGAVRGGAGRCRSHPLLRNGLAVLAAGLAVGVWYGSDVAPGYALDLSAMGVPALTSADGGPFGVVAPHLRRLSQVPGALYRTHGPSTQTQGSKTHRRVDHEVVVLCCGTPSVPASGPMPTLPACGSCGAWASSPAPSGPPPCSGLSCPAAGLVLHVAGIPGNDDVEDVSKNIIDRESSARAAAAQRLGSATPLDRTSADGSGRTCRPR